MPHVILDLKDVLMGKSCVQEFGKEVVLYNLKNGSTRFFTSLINGFGTVASKKLGYSWYFHTFRFADRAYRGIPKKIVEECSERYRELVPYKSRRVVRSIRNLGIDVAIITHDIHSLLIGAYEEMGFLESNSNDLMDNDFSFKGNFISGMQIDHNGWPRVFDKSYSLRRYMSRKGITAKDLVLVGHGPEELHMARMVENRIIVPEDISYRKLRDSAMKKYRDLELLPKMIESVFNLS